MCSKMVLGTGWLSDLNLSDMVVDDEDSQTHHDMRYGLLQIGPDTYQVPDEVRMAYDDLQNKAVALHQRLATQEKQLKAAEVFDKVEVVKMYRQGINYMMAMCQRYFESMSEEDQKNLMLMRESWRMK